MAKSQIQAVFGIESEPPLWKETAFRRIALLVICTLGIGILGLLQAGSASAHYYFECNRSRHDANDIKVMVRLEHDGTDAGTYARGFARAEHEGSWCTSDIGIADDRVVDVYVATYVDYVQSNGSLSNCRKNVKGWRGAPPGSGEWWVATIDANALRNYCFWQSKAIRSRVQAKSQYIDGHIQSAWVYSGKHEDI